MSNRRRHRPTRAERELVEMTGGAIPADDLIQIAKHSKYIDGVLFIDRTGMRLMAKYSPLGTDVAVPKVERFIAAVEKHYGIPATGTNPEEASDGS